MGTPTLPDWRLTVAGTPYALPHPNVKLRELVAYTPGSPAQLSWDWIGGAIPSRPDPFLGKAIDLEYDIGSGWVYAFRGQCVAVPWAWQQGGWGRSYRARGRRWLADLIPVTNTNTGDDVQTWNGDPDDWLNYRPERAGRSVGRIIWELLGDSTIAAALQTAGVGGYTSLGWGASATANLTTGAVTSITVNTQGDNYSAPVAVVLAGGGGSGATAVATVSAGKITAITPTLGGSGYTSPPEVWIAPFSATTLTDLSQMTVIPPFPVTISGERVLSAVEATMRQIAPNHQLHVLPDGTLRFLDGRLFGSNTNGYPNVVTLSMGDTTDKVDVSGVSMSVDTEPCYSQVQVRGADYSEMKLYETDPVTPANGSLLELFDHDNLSNTEAKTIWKLGDFDQPDVPTGLATATCTITGGGIAATFTITNSGFGYVTAPTITFTGGGGSGATASATITSGKVTAITRTAAGTGYTSAPTLTMTPPPIGGTADYGAAACIDTLNVNVTSADSTKTWSINYWDQTAGGAKGVIFLRYSAGGGVDSIVVRRIVSNAALSAGGTAQVTLDAALPNTLFNSYWIRAVGRGSSIVWRRYAVADTVLKQRLRPRASFPAPLINANGNAAAMTSTPVVELLYDIGSGKFITNTIGATFDFAAGTFDTEKPVVQVRGTEGLLRIGGNSVDGIPTKVRAYIPTRTKPLAAYAPRDGGGAPTNGGTVNSVDGITRTLVVTAPNWRDPVNVANMRAYADDVFDSVKDTVLEGVVPIVRFDAQYLTPGQGIRLSGSGYTTGYDSITLPVVECRLRWQERTGPRYRMELRFSNRRGTYSAAVYERPPTQPWDPSLGNGLFVASPAAIR